MSMYSMAWVLEMIDKNSRVGVPVVIPAAVTDLPAPVTEDAYWARVAAVAANQFGFTRVDGERPLGPLTNDAISVLAGEPGQKRINASMWEAHTYNDGHTTIDDSALTSAGFVHGYYLVNNGPRSQHVFREHVGGWVGNVPDTDPGEADALMNHKYLVRAEGLTGREVFVIAHCLYHRTRTTPFLCDQDFKCGEENSQVYFIGNTTGEVRGMLDEYQGDGLDPVAITFDEVMSLMEKFTAIHRCYDDASVARLMFDNYVAQPLPNTVEAHLYFDIQWVTDLPILGMRRAVVALLLGDQPALVLPSSVKEMNDLRAIRRTQLVVSLAVNTLWYWGEYLYVAMRAHWDEAVADLMDGKAHDMQVQLWQSSVVSAMLGRVQPVSIFRSVGTRFRYSFEKCFNATSLVVDRMTPSRETAMLAQRVNIGNNKCRLDYKMTVPPGCTAMIVGLAGSLTAQTPMAPEFSVVRPTRQRMFRRLVSYTTRANIWASGLVSRWNGYDYRYSDGSSQNRDDFLVMWAPNNDNIAPPPVFNSQVAFFNEHQWYDTMEREHVFGDEPYAFLGGDAERAFSWRLDKARLHVKFGRRNMVAVDIQTKGHAVNTMVERVELNQQYVAAVRSGYDGEMAGFRLEQLMVGLLPDPPTGNEPQVDEGGDIAQLGVVQEAVAGLEEE